MLMGIKFKANPNSLQANTLSAWMGAAKFIWNAKCQEDKYLRSFARKYLPMNTYPPIDQQYSQYKNDELSPFLKTCPSQILRNSAANWFSSYQEFFKQKDRGRPVVKKKGKGLSILLTRELFRFEEAKEGLQLFIGTKRNNIGILNVHWHNLEWLKHGLPNSIRIKKLPTGKFTVSFCYENNGKNNKSSEDLKIDRQYWFDFIRESKDEGTLQKEVLGIDRGIIVAAVTDQEQIPIKDIAKKSMKKMGKKIKISSKAISEKKM
jgi:putative transposase